MTINNMPLNSFNTLISAFADKAVYVHAYISEKVLRGVHLMDLDQFGLD